MRRDLVSFGLVLLLVGCLGVVAGLSRFPEAPVFDRAVGWPLVGPPVARLRSYFRAEPPAAAEEVTTAADVPPEAEPGDRFLRAGLGEFVLLVPGLSLHAEPESSSPVVDRVRTLRRREVLEHAGPWVRVALPRGGSAWVDPRLAPGEAPPLGTAARPPLPLPGHPPVAERLSKVRSLLGAAESRTSFGSYQVYSDFEDAVLETYLRILIGRSEEAYQERYGVVPVGTAREAIVIFDGERDYLAWQDQFDRLAGLESSGHATLGMVSVYRGDRRRSEIGLSLLHEVGHLLNRRAVGPALPPWLDEGLAEDFAHWVVAEWGGEGYKRFRHREGTHVQMWGGLASLVQAVAAHRLGQLPELAALVELEWHLFVNAESRAFHYAHAGMWIHFLLEAREGVHRQAFRDYLAAVAQGGPVSAEALSRHLGGSWTGVEGEFRLWLEAEAAAAGV